MASESLFLLQRPEALQKNELVNAIEQIEDNYLSKNYVLLNAITPGDGETSNAYLSQGRILNEALEYVRAAPKLDELYRYEPDILREEFYEGDYPDDSDEFEVFPY